jgi:hypothetical protein
MRIYNICGVFYVLDRARLTITRDTNRMRAIHNALMKCYVYKTTGGDYTYNNETL